MKYFNVENPQFRVALLYPIQSLSEIPVKGWFIGLGVGFVNWVLGQPIMWLAIATASALGFIDQRAGERRARDQDKHEPLKAKAGMYGKQIGLVMVIALIPFEFILAGLGGPELNGMLPTAAATWIAWHEFESLHEKYVQSGRKPIPVVSQFASLLKRISDAIFNPPQS